MVITLSSARALALKSNQKSQQKYKQQYDKKAMTPKFHVGDWVLVYFPQDQTGKYRKLSQPWHGPDRIVSRDDPDVTVIKMYFPDDPQIQVHQSRVQMFPDSFPPGFYWYGYRKHGPGRPSKKIQKRLAQINATLGQPPINNDTSQAEKSTEDIIGDDHNQQSVDNSRDSLSATSPRRSQKPKVATQHSSKNSKQKTTQRIQPYNLRSQRKIDSLGTG